MKEMFRLLKLWSLAVVSAALISPIMGQEFAAPDGLWELESRDSRYEVTTCGEDGQLCGKLVWLGGHAANPENMPYLNTYLIDHAKKIAPSQWSGTLNVFGQSASGTITQFSDNNIELQGCAFFVICRTYYLYRVD
jgi:hypothetical protein